MDLAAPLEVFGRCRLPSGAPAYRTAVCALTEEVETGTFTMRVPHGLSRLAQASTIIVPGTADLDVPVDARSSTPQISRRSRHTHRITVRRRIHARRHRLARRTSRDDALGGRRRVGASAPGCRRRCCRSLRRQRAHLDFGGRCGRTRPLSVHGASGLRVCRRRRHGTSERDAARTCRRASTIHRPRASRTQRDNPSSTAELDGRESRGAARHHDNRGQGNDEHPHAQPPLPGTDRYNAVAVAPSRAAPPSAISARDYRPLDRTCCGTSRIQCRHHVPRTLPRPGRHQPTAVPDTVSNFPLARRVSP